MAANEIHIADVGTVFEVTLLDGTLIVPINAASIMQIIFTKPDDTKVINVASHSTDGTDGKMRYTIVLDTELDQSGTWKIQGNVELPNGRWSTDIDKFKVYENL